MGATDKDIELHLTFRLKNASPKHAAHLAEHLTREAPMVNMPPDTLVVVTLESFNIHPAYDEESM